MGYKNGKDILPAELLAELQKYIQGELIYVPKEDCSRTGWGENNGTRCAIEQRNNEIYLFYQEGWHIKKLMNTYHLSEDSIRKIVSKCGHQLSNPISRRKDHL